MCKCKFQSKIHRFTLAIFGGERNSRCEFIGVQDSKPSKIPSPAALSACMRRPTKTYIKYKIYKIVPVWCDPHINKITEIPSQPNIYSLDWWLTSKLTGFDKLACALLCTFSACACERSGLFVRTERALRAYGAGSSCVRQEESEAGSLCTRQPRPRSI